MRLYLDASAIIYSVEGPEPIRQNVLARIAQVESARGGAILTSRLSRLECRVWPLREGQSDLLAAYDQFFTRKLVEVAEITHAVVEQATELRARHRLKTPDAIHLATAIQLQADLVLTGDRDMSRCTQIKVEML